MALIKTLSTGSIAIDDADGKLINCYPKLVDFEAKFRLQEEKDSLQDRLKTVVKKKFNTCSVKKSFLGLFPIIQTVKTYSIKDYLPSDIIAGLIAGVMMIPQGMAFAALSTLPPIVGLYISLFASLTYVLLGTGRQLSWGCIAVWSLMMADILDNYDNSAEGKAFVASHNTSGLLTETDGSILVAVNSNLTNITDLNAGNKSSNFVENKVTASMEAITARRIEVASGVSVFAGLILIFASRIGLSRVSAIMSNSLHTGFTVGISFHVVTSQLKGLLGIKVERYKGPGQLIRTWITLLQKLPETNVAVLIISLICMLIIYLVKKFINEKYKKKMRVPIPIEIFVVIIATIVSYFGDFNSEYDVKIVEDVPVGLPTPKLPNGPLVIDYVSDAIVIVVLSYAQSLAMAKTMGLKHDYEIDSNQEMLACGVCSLVCGLFSGYITGASVSRSIVQDGAGGKTQIASIIAATLVLLVIMVIGPYFYYLPTCVLSAIIVVNLRTMFLKLLLIPSEWRKSKFDCAVWVFACFATVVLNPAMGLLASVLFSLFIVVFRSMIHPVEEIGQIETNASAVHLRSLKHYSSVQKLESVRIIRIKTPLYFFNADSSTIAVYEKTGINPIKIKEKRSKSRSHSNSNGSEKNSKAINGDCHVEDGSNKQGLEPLNMKILVIDVSEVAFIDNMGVAALELIIKEYSSIGIEVLIISVPESLFEILQSTGFWKKQGDRLFVTLEAALASIAATVENSEPNNLVSKL